MLRTGYATRRSERTRQLTRGGLTLYVGLLAIALLAIDAPVVGTVVAGAGLATVLVRKAIQRYRERSSDPGERIRAPATARGADGLAPAD